MEDSILKICPQKTSGSPLNLLFILTIANGDRPAIKGKSPDRYGRFPKSELGGRALQVRHEREVRVERLKQRRRVKAFELLEGPLDTVRNSTD